MAKVKQAFAGNDVAAAVRCSVNNTEAQRLLFLPENRRFLEAFVRYGHEFHYGITAGFVAAASPEMLKTYFEMGYLLDENAQCEMVRRFGMDVLREFLAYDILCEQAQVAVLDNFSREDQIAFMELVGRDGGWLNALAEKRLFEHKALALIAAFVRAGGVFSDEGECALVRLGVRELTDAYFSQHDPWGTAVVLLDGKEPEAAK